MNSSEECEILSEDEIKSIVQKTIGTSDFLLSKYNIHAASGNLTGFLGKHLRINVNVVSGGGKNQLSYFVKTLPTGVPQHLNYAIGIRAFYKEIELYKTVFVDLDNSQRNPTKWYPKYYYSKGHEMFVLEDLSPRGYYMLPERTLMDEDHARASLKSMAAMHAASFVFEDRFRRGLVKTLSPNKKALEQNVFDIGELYSHLTFETEASDLKGHPGNTLWEAGIRSQLAVVDLMSNYSEREKEVIKEKFPGVLRRALKLVKPSSKYKNIFIHGDLWANNILFRKGNDGKVEDAILIDFQLARYAPPAHDVMMFMYLVQNNSFRERKQTEMLNYYYSVLSEELQKNEISVESVLPWSTFQESCEYYAELGVLSSVIYFQLSMVPPHIVEQFISSPETFTNIFLVDRSKMLQECFTKDEIFRTRMSEAMNNTVSRYILV